MYLTIRGRGLIFSSCVWMFLGAYLHHFNSCSHQCCFLLKKRELADYLIYPPSLPLSGLSSFSFPPFPRPVPFYPPLHSCCTLPHLGADRLVDINRAGLPCGNPKSHDSHAGIMWHPLPRMLQRLPTSVAFLGVKFHQATNEIFGLIGNAVPRDGGGA